MTAGKLTATVIFAILSFGTATVLLLGTGLQGPVALAGLLAAGGAVAATWLAPTGRKAWGRGFLVYAAIWFIVPMIAIGVFGDRIEAASQAGTLFQEQDDYSGTVVTGLFVGAAVMFGWIVGAICVVLGLLLNRTPPPANVAPGGDGTAGGGPTAG